MSKDRKKTAKVKKSATPARVTAKKSAKKIRKATSGPYLEIRHQLAKMKEDLLTQILKTAKKERYSLKREVGDLYDQAYSDRERELTLMLGDIESQKLKEINDALFRIDRGEYGACENCTSTIPTARLRIMPFARMCVTCQSGLENEMGEQRRREVIESATHASRAKIDEEEA
ncbi:MAG: TraR/DksA C4-type zinc finger protein [Nitrospirae bacterium]|nr:TraR/DksA C4-type zinc finger protein [Nitrospirota bacterium]